ncbi:DUF6191 domain-containing protein [Spirillospora sp. CA-108201]
MDDIDDLLADLEEQEGIDLIYDALVPRTEHLIEYRYRDSEETVCLSLASDDKTPVDYLMLTAGSGHASSLSLSIVIALFAFAVLDRAGLWAHRRFRLPWKRDEENDGGPPRTRVDLDAGTAIVRRPPGSA